MKVERLSKGKSKRIILAITIIVLAIGIIYITNSKAKYQVTKSVQIVNGNVSYSPYDFKIMAMYKNDGGEDAPITEIPENGYMIDETRSYCLRNNEQIKGLLKTINGIHIISKLHSNDKCYLWFNKSFTAEERVTALGKTTQTGQISFAESDKSEHKDSSDNSIMYSGTDNDGITYYFRGVVNDNWVRYGTTSDNKSIWWRIVRINGDGTIRMIYAGTTDLNSNNPPGTTGTDTQITVDGENTFLYSNYGYGDNKYVGYQYADNNVHGKGIDSYAADRANEWFKTNLLEEWNNGNGRIDNNAGFCADRTSYTDNTGTSEGGGTGTTTTYYAAYIRFQKGGNWQNPQKPIFKCTNTSDLFTYTGAINGTRSLTYPVGLITADEVVYAGGFGGKDNYSYYLFIGNDYWTMSPYYFRGAYVYVFYVNHNGQLIGNQVNYKYGVRPVINLKADTQFTGNGKSGSPFVVQ